MATHWTQSFGVSAVEDYWPRRLLNVRDWTSYPRNPSQNSTYGPFTSPRYNIISYTWGRYRVGNGTGTSIDVRGVGWDIPSIQRVRWNDLLDNGLSIDGLPEGGFDSDEFQAVLRRVSQRGSFVWVDVACIPQCGPNDALRLEADDEINHQAGIFAKADTAYIWLHGMSDRHLDDALHGLQSGDWNRAARLFSDPWFTSLWTLQEAFLRKDAILLSRKGNPSQFPGSSSHITLKTIMELTHNLLYHGQQLFYQQFRYIGIDTLLARNPLVLLSVLPHRTVQHAEDNICGIMQVFGISLDRSIGLQRLTIEFGKGIVQRSPTISQAFTHKKLDAEPSWLIPIPSPGDFSVGRPYSAGLQTPFDYTKLIDQNFYDMVEIAWPHRATIEFYGDSSMVVEARYIALGTMVAILQNSCPMLRSAARSSSTVASDEDRDSILQENHGRYTNSPHCSVHLDKGRWCQPNPFVPVARDPLRQAPADPLKEIHRLAEHKNVGGVLVMGKFVACGEEAYLGILIAKFRAADGTPVRRRIGFCTWRVAVDDCTVKRTVIT